MTISEKLCQDINRKFYFNEFVMQKLVYRNTNGESEICDGLIDLKDFYIVLQIKERDYSKRSKKDDKNWLNRKVYHDAVRQINNTIDILNNEKITLVDFCGEEVLIDNKKEIVPLIIFKADEIKEYNKIYISSTKGIDINVFSLEDYLIMMENIIVPIDILSYLKIRKNILKNISRGIIFDSVCENRILFANIKDEQSIVNYYLVQQNCNSTDDIKKLSCFLDIIKEYANKIVTDKTNYKEILYRLLTMGRTPIISFVDRWDLFIQDIKNEKFNYQHRIVLLYNNLKKVGILFLSYNKNKKMDQEECLFFMRLFAQKYELDETMLIFGCKEENNQYFIQWMLLQENYNKDLLLNDILRKYNLWNDR